MSSPSPFLTNVMHGGVNWRLGERVFWRKDGKSGRGTIVLIRRQEVPHRQARIVFGIDTDKGNEIDVYACNCVKDATPKPTKPQTAA